MNDMLGVFIVYQMGVNYNIEMGSRFVCHCHSDFAGFCDPHIQTTRIYNPLAIWIHVYTCLSGCKFLSWWVMFSDFMKNGILENHSCSHIYLENILDSTVWHMFHMCEEPINITVFCESAHRKVTKSSEFCVLHPCVVTNMSQVNKAEWGNLIFFLT